MHQPPAAAAAVGGGGGARATGPNAIGAPGAPCPENCCLDCVLFRSHPQSERLAPLPPPLPFRETSRRAPSARLPETGELVCRAEREQGARAGHLHTSSSSRLRVRPAQGQRLLLPRACRQRACGNPPPASYKLQQPRAMARAGPGPGRAAAGRCSLGAVALGQGGAAGAGQGCAGQVGCEEGGARGKGRGREARWWVAGQGCAAGRLAAPGQGP